VAKTAQEATVPKMNRRAEGYCGLVGTRRLDAPDEGRTGVWLSRWDLKGEGVGTKDGVEKTKEGGGKGGTPQRRAEPQAEGEKNNMRKNLEKRREKY